MIVSAVTPGQVAPPFDPTDGTHGGANRVGTASRPVAGSQAGLGSSAGAGRRRRPAGRRRRRPADAARPPPASAGNGRRRPSRGVVSAGGAGRLGRDAGFFGLRRVDHREAAAPPPGLPAAAPSGPGAGRSASTRRMADAAAEDIAVAGQDWASATANVFGPPGRGAPGGAPLRSLARPPIGDMIPDGRR